MTDDPEQLSDAAIGQLASQLAAELNRRLAPTGPDEVVRVAARAIVEQLREQQRRQTAFDTLVDEIVAAVREELARPDTGPLNLETVATSEVLPSDVPAWPEPAVDTGFDLNSLGWR